MKKMTVAVKATAVVLYLFVVAGIASSVSVLAADTPPVGNCFEAFSYAELIFADMQKFVREEMAAADDDSEGEYSPEEAKAMFASLKRSEERLDVLIAGLSGLTDDAATNEGKTVRATRDYLAMLKNMAHDMGELVAYGFEYYEAVMLMDKTSEDVNAEDIVDYDDWINAMHVYTSEVYTNSSRSLDALKKIKPPAYLAITHGDVVKRVEEFRDFAVDFSNAATLGDPLRIYSCIYRMGRITVTFGQCDANMTSDIFLQLRQAERRLDGQISTLRAELSAYFALLNLKKGGD